MGRSLPEILARYNPEAEFADLDLPKDRVGEPYLPLKPSYLKPMAIDPGQPGKGIMVHVMDEYKDPIEKQLASIGEEGFVTLRRMAHFSTGPFSWGTGETVVAVACRTPSRWSREYLDPQEIVCHRWSEGLIGLSLDEVQEVAPKGARNVLERHPKDEDDHWAKKRQRQAELTGVLAYIPLAHFLGCVKFPNLEYSSLMSECRDKIALYMSGTETEQDYVDWLCSRVRDKEIESLGDGSYEPEGGNFWGMVAAAHTQSALLDEISIWSAGERKFALADVKTSYPKTTAMREDALSTFENR